MGILEARGFAGGQLTLDTSAARAAFEALRTTVPLERRIGQAYRIAVNNIAEEITNLAIRHGADPRDFSLVAYGAAGPMLLPAALELLGVRRVIVPPHPGLFSALGLLASDLVYSESRSRYVLLRPQAASEIAAIFASMESGLRAQLGDGARTARVRRSFDGRLLGQTWETPFVELPDGDVDAAAIDAMIAAFHTEYARRNGRAFTQLPVQAVTYRVQLVVASPKFEFTPLPVAIDAPPAAPVGTRTLHQYLERDVDAALYERERLVPGQRIAGPAIIQEPLCTTLVPPGLSASVGPLGELCIEVAR
jgi:N-methylhydantoinase A